MSDADKTPAPDALPEEYRDLAARPSPRNRPQQRPPRPAGNKVPNLDAGDSAFGAKKVSLLRDDIEREMQGDLEASLAGLSDADMKSLYGEAPRGKKAQQSGSAPRKATVMAIRGKDVFLDVGGRIQGMLPVLQFEAGPPNVGDVVEVTIEGHDRDGLLILSRKGAAVQADWDSVAEGMTVEARVVAVNKGGLSVEVGGIKGFMPVSQIEMFRVEDLNPYVGQKLKCIVTEVDREDRNLLVSARAVKEIEREEMGETLWANLVEGQVREGVVRLVKDFGAFVDLGGADGLLPTGEMSWQRIKSPLDVVQPGNRVKVQILKLDHEARKILLGMRQLVNSPWENVAANYPVGAVVKGKVTRLMEFGAFVELEPGVEGMVHISEISTVRVSRINNVVKVGDEVNVKVLTFDIAARRMALSIKAAAKVPESEVKAAPAEDDEPESTVAPPPVRKYAVPLRGGVGAKVQIPMPKPPGA